MKEIPRTKKLEIAQYYILGLSYKEIEAETDVSHGSIVNIVKELDSGNLDIPGTPLDQVDDLRQLSLDLKKRGLSSSQSRLGISFFERIHNLGIVPEHLDHWAELMSKLTTIDFLAEDFLNAALRMQELEKSEGKTYEVLTEEYEKAEVRVDQLAAEANSLVEKRTTLSKEVDSISAQLEGLKTTRDRLEIDVDGLTLKVTDLRAKANENKAESSRLAKEVSELKRQKVKLSSEVDGKEESLIRLNDIGLLDEDLLRLKAILERIAKDSGAGQEEVRKRFFAALGTFKDICELQKCQEQETAALDHLTNDKALLTGQIVALEQTKNMIQGQITETASSAMGKITDAGEKAALELQQLAGSIKQSFDSLVTQAAEVGMAVGEMKTAVKKGEASQANLSNFIRDVRTRVVKSDG